MSSDRLRFVREKVPDLRSRVGILLAERDEARQVVGLEHEHAQQRMMARLAGAQSAHHEPQAARQARLELGDELADVDRRPEDEKRDLAKTEALLRREPVDESVRLLEAQSISVEGVEEDRIEHGPADLRRGR